MREKQGGGEVGFWGGGWQFHPGVGSTVIDPKNKLEKPSSRPARATKPKERVQ